MSYDLEKAAAKIQMDDLLDFQRKVLQEFTSEKVRDNCVGQFDWQKTCEWLGKNKVACAFFTDAFGQRWVQFNDRATVDRFVKDVVKVATLQPTAA